jgi:hypothetical protein
LLIKLNLKVKEKPLWNYKDLLDEAPGFLPSLVEVDQLAVGLSEAHLLQQREQRRLKS